MKYSEIVECLKTSLPYYERDDKDDFLYIATREDLNNTAMNIYRMVNDPTAGDSLEK